MLNQGQQLISDMAYDWFYHGTDQVFEIDGLAGTGKSFLMGQILKRLGLNKNQYMPMAYTGQAAIVMRTKGFTTAKSIHASLYEVVEVEDVSELTKAYGLPTKHKEFRKRLFIDPDVRLFFIDEAYMVPDYMVEDILSFGIKVIVCGDCHQLPPIGGKPAFLIGSKVHHLTQIMRQSENDPILYIANRAMKGLPIHNGMYGNNVLVAYDDELTPQMIAKAESIICGTNNTRYNMNSYIRSLAGINSYLPIFGERIICRQNNWDIAVDGISLSNGLCGTVVSNPDPSNFNIDGTFTIDFKPDLCNNVFYKIPVNYNYFIANYEERKQIKEDYKKGWMQGELFEFAYASTTHLAQGAEYGGGIYIEEFLRSQIQNQLNYTGITRFKKWLIYLKKRTKNVYIPELNNIY